MWKSKFSDDAEIDFYMRSRICVILDLCLKGNEFEMVCEKEGVH
jgi:hypothetical protein